MHGLNDKFSIFNIVILSNELVHTNFISPHYIAAGQIKNSFKLTKNIKIIRNYRALLLNLNQHNSLKTSQSDFLPSMDLKSNYIGVVSA
jgi:hypothetical protein